MTDRDDEVDKVIPLYGRDEMNLIEFPFGPISSTTAKTLEIEHDVWDRKLKSEITRRLIITGSDKWGLPRPIDDQVYLGLKMLTLESGYASQLIEFTRYQLCRVIRWEPDGRSYGRLEESLDRIKGTTLKFKDAWYDNAEKQYKSKAFSIIDDYELCSRDQMDRARLAGGDARPQRSYFKWSDVMWKSFQDNYIKKLDMRMFHRIAEGRRREVPLRLFRILDKRFYKKSIARFRLRRLCIGTLGLSPNYGPAQMLRVLERAIKWLIECEYLEAWWCTGPRENPIVHFRRRRAAEWQHVNPGRRGAVAEHRAAEHADSHTATEDILKQWIVSSREEDLEVLEIEALEVEFGTPFERGMVLSERQKGIPILSAGRTRLEYVRRYYFEGELTRNRNLLVGV
jgi:hypothetical protein